MRLKPRFRTSVALRATLGIFSIYALAVQAPDGAYRQDFEKWKAELVDDLKQNWLPLVGLYWLKPGANTFGSASDNAMVLTSAPAHAGVFILRGEAVALELEPGVPGKVQGRSITREELKSDVSGDPTVIELGSLRLHVIQRGKRIGIRVKDVNSPAARNYTGAVFFPLDMTYRVTATFVPPDGKRTLEVPNVLGDVTPTPVAGDVRFHLDGHDLTLTASGGDPEHGLSFVFRDLTSGKDTYPGGRFLSTDPVKDGHVILDFNRAYSPPCAVTAYATCPLAPKENRLQVRIPAGERYLGKHAHS